MEKTMVTFIKKANESAYKGFIKHPPIINKEGRKEIKFFDALFFGIPVAVENSLKVVDHTVWEKVVSAFTDKEMHDLTFENVLFRGVSFNEFTFQCIFENCHFDTCLITADWSNGKFLNCSFKDCDLTAAGIRMWHAINSQFLDCSFKQSNFNCDMMDCSYENCCFQNATIYTSLIKNSSFKNCDFSFSNLRRNNFYRCNLVAPDFLSATINGTRFDASEIMGANYENIKITMGGATDAEVAHLEKHIFKAFTPALN